MKSNVIQARTDGPLCEITLNRPSKLNAMNLEWVQSLYQTVSEISTNPDLRVVVIRGEGRAFCSGLDLDMMSEQGMPDDFFPLQEAAFTGLERMRAIVIAQIHGYCLGGGLQLALACDIRIASEDAKLGLPASLEGLPPGVAAWRLPRFVGAGRALRLSLLGTPIDAQEALSMGLVDHVLPDDGFAEKAREIVDQYASVPFTAGIGIKEMVRSAFDVDFTAAFDRTREVIDECLAGPDVTAAQREWAARRAAKR